MEAQMEAKQTRLFLDMDGVFCDFERRVQELQEAVGENVRSSVQFDHNEKRAGKDLIWPMIFERDPMFFANLKPMAGAMELWQSVQRYLKRAGQPQPIFLTGCPKGEFRALAEQGKRKWIADHFVEGKDIQKVHVISVKETATFEDKNFYLKQLEEMIDTVNPGEIILIFSRPDQKQFFSVPLKDGRKPILLDDRARAKEKWEKENGYFMYHESEPDETHFLWKEMRNTISKGAVKKSSLLLNSLKGGRRLTRVSNRLRRSKKTTRRNRSLYARKTITSQ